MSFTMEPTPGVVIASRYRVVKELGRGGMGAVYLVEHVNTGERHALKALLTHAGANQELVERFRREARTPSRIRSENVVKVTDADAAPELGGAPFMVMELLEGQDLDQRLSQGGPLSPQELIDILTPVASVLDQAHALGIVHRDLKPDNLFLHHRNDGEMVVKVVDFGIAKLLDTADGGSEAKLTNAGMIMGTPLYMAPEQARGDVASIGPATDIWAMGQLAYVALTGQEYWPGPSMGEVVAQILTSPLAPPSSRVPTLPPAFDAWFARSCARDANQRWPSAGAQLEALRVALSGVPTTATLAAAPAAVTPAGHRVPSMTSVQGPALASQGAVTAASPTPAPSTGGRGVLLGIGLFVVVAAGAGAAVIMNGPGLAGESGESSAAKEAAASATTDAAGKSGASTTPPAGGDKRGGTPQVMSALNGGAPGYYDPQQLLTLIEPHMAEVRACYNDELSEQPDLKGTVYLTLMLGADHRPMGATCVEKMEGGMPRALCPCLQGKVTSWTFPPPKKPLPMISVGYKFICDTK